jgi:hypothetical protein
LHKSFPSDHQAKAKGHYSSKNFKRNISVFMIFPVSGENSENEVMLGGERNCSKFKPQIIHIK